MVRAKAFEFQFHLKSVVLNKVDGFAEFQFP